VLLRLCCTCGRTYDPYGGGYHRAGKCQAYERTKSRERRASSAAVKTRDSRTWQRARALPKQRDGGRCVRCGASERLEVHHLVAMEQGGERFMLSNLVTLCRSCHEDEEREAKSAFLELRSPTHSPDNSREKASRSRWKFVESPQHPRLSRLVGITFVLEVAFGVPSGRSTISASAGRRIRKSAEGVI
jgi:5-methylcytosine-specific restriction endonuclease McrA